MQVTDVRVRRVEKEGKMKAIVSITLDNEFVIHDIKVIEGEKGLFIAMPSRKAADGEYRDIAHPINSGTREMIQSIILDKYESTLLENEEEALAEAAAHVRHHAQSCDHLKQKIKGSDSCSRDTLDQKIWQMP